MTIENNEYLVFEKAEQEYENKRFSAAFDLFTKISVPELYDDVQNYRGCCMLNMGNVDDAIELFSLQVKKHPSYSRPLYNLGRCCLAQNDFGNAYQYFQKAIELNPCDSYAWFYIGVYYEAIKQIPNAIHAYKKVIELDNEDIDAYLNLTRCLSLIEDMKEALAVARKAFDLSVQDDTVYNYTCLLNKLSQYEQAFDILIDFDILNNSDDIGLLTNLLFSARKLGKTETANAAAKKILSIEPNNEYAKSVRQRI